ncbi:hypothetical protein [Sphingomonas sp. ERG5]|nr:hypothetical protein [Sphingomonas sp. ERG5]
MARAFTLLLILLLNALSVRAVSAAAAPMIPAWARAIARKGPRDALT